MKMDTEQEIRDKYYQDGLEDGKKEGFKAGLEKARELVKKVIKNNMYCNVSNCNIQSEYCTICDKGARNAEGAINEMIDEEIKGVK